MKGLVHIYCGDGKGKTTASMGLAVRCSAYGEKVVVAQFLKSGTSGEIEVIKKLDNIEYIGGKPTNKFTFQMNCDEKAQTKQSVQEIFDIATQTAINGARMLVLDEIMASISCGFIDEMQVIDFINNKPEQLEVVMTGRNPPESLINIADYVTEMRKIKHPYEEGIPSRTGIEM